MKLVTQMPWLSGPWNQAARALGAQRLPAGVLVLGRPGSGRSALVEAMVRARLCLHPQADLSACGSCAACREMDAGAHPDCLNVRPEEGKSSILIDQIRELSRAMSLTAGEKGARCAIIAPADALTEQASNALLKTLEEPQKGTSLILIADSSAHLLPTVVSRCLRLVVPVPPPQQALAWLHDQLGERSDWPLLLALAAGAPLVAKALAEEHDQSLLPALNALFAAVSRHSDPVAIANEFSSWPLRRFAALIGWLAWLGLRAKLVGNARGVDFPGLDNMLKLAARANSRRLVDVWSEAIEVANDALVRNDALARERLLLLFVNAFCSTNEHGVQR